MKDLSLTPALRKAAAFLALAGSARAHSWIESASKVAPNGTMVGEIGYARGYVPRTSTDPPYTDTIPTYLLPVNGQSAYSGDEIINKFKFEANPKFPMLEAAPGDFIALQYLENGHTTLPDNQPNKPRNRGTVFLYGTSRPEAEEKLFDVHLRWNRNGDGGDGRGMLLATRNYDDGQCFQPNAGPLNMQRANENANEGAKPDQELACQVDLKLPDNLEPGSIYTVYWYWDWPDLSPNSIDIEATKNGIFPWAGSFMRGDKNPHGFTPDAIARNESYSSVIDIKITGKPPGSERTKFGAGPSPLSYIDDQNIYSKAIQEQMKNNYAVDLDAAPGSGDAPSAPSASSAPSAPSNGPSTAVTSTAAIATTTKGSCNGGGETVTVTETVTPSVVFTTIYTTVPAEPLVTESPSDTEPVPVSTVMVTVTSHVPAAGSPGDATPSIPFPTKEPPAPKRMRRSNWAFGMQ
jgi:hypothetical protein